MYLDPTYEEAFAKRTVSVFEVDRRTRKVCRSTKDNVMKAVKSMGYTQVVRGIGAFMWDVLLPNTEEAMKMVNSDKRSEFTIFMASDRIQGNEEDQCGSP